MSGDDFGDEIYSLSLSFLFSVPFHFTNAVLFNNASEREMCVEVYSFFLCE